MLAAPKSFDSDGTLSATQAPLALGFPERTTPGGKGPLPADRWGRIPSRTAVLEKIETAGYAEFLHNRLEQIRLPPRFSAPALLTELKARDQVPGLRELKREIDNEAVNLTEILQAHAQRRSDELMGPGRGRLRDAVQAIRHRLELLLQQREQHFGWAMLCLSRGDLSPGVASELARSFLWESVQIRLTADTTLPAAFEAGQRARSRRDLDNAVRQLRVGQREQAVATDLAMFSRERLILFIDLWNSRALADTYQAKSWQESVLDGGDLSELLAKMRQTTEDLVVYLNTTFGRDRVSAALGPGPSNLAASAAVFAALLEEEPA